MRREAGSYRRASDFKTNYYVDGNTVRRLEGEPEERRQRKLAKEQARRRQEMRHAARRNREKAYRMNVGYVLFCTMALAVVCAVSVAYIRIQSDITGRMKNIANLESQIADLKAENDAALKRISLTTDLDAVKEEALKLGMGYAGEDQIVYYSVEDEDYMDQHSDIPEK